MTPPTALELKRPLSPRPGSREVLQYSFVMYQQEAGVRHVAKLTNLTGTRSKVLGGTEVPPLPGQQQEPSSKLTKRERSFDLILEENSDSELEGEDVSEEEDEEEYNPDSNESLSKEETSNVERETFYLKKYYERGLGDNWLEQLPYLYNPGSDVTVDEQLVPFRGRCLFRQYMPSKPARYGVKIWVACDAKSSYAWKIQVYTGKLADGHLQKPQEMPPEEEDYHGWYEREVFSSKFAFTPTTLVSYLPKKNKNVVLLITLHRDRSISDRDDRKPIIIMDYNRNKGGVDNLNMVIGAYSCRRRTARCPLAIFQSKQKKKMPVLP
ncbi:unnamed protein product [Lepeophtheirus salmonis]|uniref:(salmon louse) hypothetical protein n=1 Tax=Lepeophtheirus salmonis TaxID=72036 RepID=A0A7R8H3P4_LEPSM|nr:unnamed protein product [Lepeophtheirus salmonis]CAF2833598.1 unnamed protein product [Lepeophtheirus salmonis]